MTQQAIDKRIDQITENVIASVKDAKYYGIMTACIIEGEFVLVSTYEIERDMKNALNNAANNYENIIVRNS